MTEYLLAVTLALLVGSNVFWAVIAHKLINKILSRSYYEYKQAENVGKVRARVTPTAPAMPPEPSKTDQTSLEALNQLKSLFMPFSGGQ